MTLAIPFGELIKRLRGESRVSRYLARRNRLECELGHDPWRASVMDGRMGLVRTCTGMPVEVPNAKGETQPLFVNEVQVFLDDKPLPDCVYADELAGIALRLVDADEPPYPLLGKVRIAPVHWDYCP